MIYEFRCEKHGVFETFRTMATCTEPEPCPRCKMPARRIMSIPNVHIVQGGKWLPLGTGSPGAMIPSSETGGLDIFVPSYGLMEQAEVDYVAGEAVAKEKARVKKRKGHRSQTQERLAAYADLARKAPKGKRAKTVKEAIAESGDRLRRNT